jgi:hypothetical protein
MLMGVAGWIYYPSIVDFEDRKRQERKQKALQSAVKDNEQQPASA